MTRQVSIAFDPSGVVLPVTSILPLKQIKSSVVGTVKYQQVLSSVLEIGVIEPLIVFPEKGKSDSFLLLDGHIRLAVLKQIGHREVRCLVATDDETYTYNKRVNRMATIQEHNMILKATRNGVSEERIAKVLKVNVAEIRTKRDLLNGICKEAAEHDQLLCLHQIAKGRQKVPFWKF
jgi:ParB-like chromosome segregation protein Spo0J